MTSSVSYKQALNHHLPSRSNRHIRLIRRPNPQRPPQRPIIIQQITRRCRIHNFLTRQIDGEEIRAFEFDGGSGFYRTNMAHPSSAAVSIATQTQTKLLRMEWKEREGLPPESDVVGCNSILLPSQSYTIASVECEKNIISHIRDAAAAIGGGADGEVELGVVLDVRYRGAVLGAFVVDVDLLFEIFLAGWIVGCRGGEEWVCARTSSVTADESVGRPPVAKALSQRWAIPSTSDSEMQRPWLWTKVMVARR